MQVRITKDGGAQITLDANETESLRWILRKGSVLDDFPLGSHERRDSGHMWATLTSAILETPKAPTFDPKGGIACALGCKWTGKSLARAQVHAADRAELQTRGHLEQK